MKQVPGVTRQEEEKKLLEIVGIAKTRVEENKQSIKDLAEELHAMQEDFDESDKEMQTLWHDTDARFKFVNLELKRAEQARKKPYFGRIDFTDKKIGEEESYYIGRSVIAKNPADPEVIDWRAPVAGVYYDSQVGDTSYSVKGEGRFDIHLSRKRTYEIEGENLKDFYDSDVIANDELLTKYLAKNKRAVLGEIIATIQKEQNEVIRKKPQHNLIIQGAAGSGKTTVAMHRISYILYNYELEFAPEDFYIIGSNQVLLNYITGVLPELNVYGVCQMTMEQLFIRLLYEDWNRKFKVKPVVKGITPKIKGTWQWFQDLEEFCGKYEDSLIPREDVRLEKNDVLLLPASRIERILEQSVGMSRADKITRLTEHLMAKLENELSGKYYSYTASEKDKLTRHYSKYFGKREWKGSIFDLYEDFLTIQRGKGHEVPFVQGEFDVYDLAALAYLYKRIKEVDVIREAAHVVIDEAQDFGMMAYGCLKYCLSKCTYTIMGDVSQNISLDYGINDWEELRRLMLPGDYDYFGLLRKSYRNTVEISQFATDILCHGTFPIYPVEPIIRHGKEVEVVGCQTYEKLVDRTVEVLKGWQEAHMETIAVICANEKEVEKLSKHLKGRVPLLPTKQENLEFKEGIMVLSLEYTKGLEFDSVLLFDASDANYPLEDGYVKRLYVASTRALHELVVLHTGALTKIIAEPISDEKRNRVFVTNEGSRKKAFIPPEDTRTKEEIYRDEAIRGHKEMKERETYGPKRIVIPKKVDQLTASTTKTTKFKSIKPDNTIKTNTYKDQVLKEIHSKVVSDNQMAVRRAKLVTEFGDMPESSKLQVPGHSSVDLGVRFVKKGAGFFEFSSNHGVLRLIPMAKDRIRVCFAKDALATFPDPIQEFKGEIGKVRTRENQAQFEMALDKIAVRIDKRTGALQFLDANGKVLLSEREKEPRLLLRGQAWQFFDWKKEVFIAKGLDALKSSMVDKSARYISYGKDFEEWPGLSSPKGYELAFPPKTKVLVCTVPTYGQYIAFEEQEQIEYYIKAK